MVNGIIDKRDLKRIMTDKPMTPEQHAALQRQRVARRRWLEDVCQEKSDQPAQS